MQPEPQAIPYRPDPVILKLADWLGSPVEAANFPETTIRYRNDLAASEIGLDALTDAEWVQTFGRFAPLSGNLPQPLALKYHGHQFRHYNPDIGDGRGFLFAQMRDNQGRLIDLGTKGSGQTPYSRNGDGRLTLKGAVREILASEFLQALGVNTSRTLSVIETGEELMRGDEPSPARSAVLVRQSHGHIRIGTFQRLLAHEEAAQMQELIEYCLTNFPAPPTTAPSTPNAPPEGAPAVQLMHQIVERMADLAASYMVAGFVHGVLNTDNMNISGESFDYGPWRWLPQWNPGFTAAYFDQNGLYSFGRQPEAIHWNCGQMAVALRLLADAPPLIAALDRYGPLYMAAISRRWCWRLGVKPATPEQASAILAASERQMRASEEQPDIFFHRHRGGREASGELADALSGVTSVGNAHAYWNDEAPQSMLIEEVEAIWSAIEESDNWQPLYDKVTQLRRLGKALGPPPAAQGHQLEDI